MLEILENANSFHIVNGLQCGSINCDSDFTFFRGNSRSQNDVCLINQIDVIHSFSILDINTYSDHKPLRIIISSKPVIPLDINNACAKYAFSYDHHDINRN